VSELALPTPGQAALPTITGRRKAAILCVSLGHDTAAEIFRHLPGEMVEQLAVELAKTPVVEPDHADAVLNEVVQTAYAKGYLTEGGMRYAREVLERAVGPARAAEILQRLAVMIEQSPFEFLRGSSPEQIYAFLRNEHPQTISLVLAHLPSNELSANVLQLFGPEEQAEVAMRIALMGQTSPEVVKEIAAVMEAKLENVLQHEYAEAGGVASLAQMLNNSDRATEQNILKHLAAENQELADEVRSLLFVFEDILTLDDRSIQLVLKEVDSKDLPLALRGASDEVKNKLLSNMSQRGADMLREEIEYMPPQRRRVVEEAQSRIVAAVRKLEDSGAIVIARGGDASGDELIA
jgi:flagellar motor switch protein FliG